MDLPEVKKLLNRTRSTIYRLMETSDLIQVHVRGDRATYITLESIERYKSKGTGKLAEDPDIRAERKRHIDRWFNRTTGRPDPQLMLPFPDQSLLPEE